MARGRAKDQRQSQAGSRRRSTEFFVAWRVYPSGRREKGLPSLATAGLFARNKFYCRSRRRDLFIVREGAFKRPKRSDDLGGHAAHAGAGQADRTRRAGRKIENPATDERAPIVDRHDDAAGSVSHTQLGPERQCAVSRGHGVLIEALAGGGLAAGS